MWFVIRNINETFSYKITFFFSVWAYKVQLLDYSHTTSYCTLLLLPPFHVLFSFLNTSLPKSRPAWWIDCGLKYSYIPCFGFSGFRSTLAKKPVLTRKLMYSIYCFLLSSVEFILKEKIVPETGIKKKKKGLICIKNILQIHCFGGRKEGYLLLENTQILMVLL